MRVIVIVMAVLLMAGCATSKPKPVRSVKAVPDWAGQIVQSPVVPAPSVLHVGTVVTNRPVMHRK